MSGKAWSTEMQALIDSFIVSPLPPRFSDLHTGVKIVDPQRWRDAILSDIEQGPDNPRATTGALQSELEAFFRMPQPPEEEPK